GRALAETGLAFDVRARRYPDQGSPPFIAPAAVCGARPSVTPGATPPASSSQKSPRNAGFLPHSCHAPARAVLGARRRAFARGMRCARGLACLQILQRERARRARLHRYHDPRYHSPRRRLRRGRTPFQRQGDRGIDRAHWDLQYERARAASASTRPRAGRALSFSEFLPVSADGALVVEDDRFLRVVAIVLDPNTSPERTAAYADFFAHDEPDFDGYCQQVRARAGKLFPREVRLVETQNEMRAALPGSPALVVESLRVGKEELAAGSELRVVQKFGLSPRNIDTAACAAQGIKVLTIRRRANIACAELAIALM